MQEIYFPTFIPPDLSDDARTRAASDLTELAQVSPLTLEAIANRCARQRLRARVFAAPGETRLLLEVDEDGMVTRTTPAWWRRA